MAHLSNAFHQSLVIAGWLFRAWLWAMLSGLSGASAQTNDTAAIEWQVKAAYLYKFGHYVEWPTTNGNDGPVTIGILGDDALAEALQKTVIGRTVNGRVVNIRKLQRDSALTGLNILFVGSPHASELPDILSAIKGAPVLIVTDSENALSAGSMINFVMVDGKLRFEVAPKAALKGNLTISARLLAVAHKVAM